MDDNEEVIVELGLVSEETLEFSGSGPDGVTVIGFE